MAIRYEGSVPTSYNGGLPSNRNDNPEERRLKTEDSAEFDFTAMKNEKLKRIQRDIRDYNIQSFRQQLGNRVIQVLIQKQ